MKVVSDEFKAAAIAPVKVIGGTVSLLDGSASYTENDFLQSITLESTGEMFGSVATIATFKLKGDSYNLEGKEVYIKYSLQTDNGFEDIDYGIYKVVQQSVSKNKESTEFTAHSKMLQMQEGNYAELEGFPMTVSEAVSEIASRENFTVSDMSDLPNADYSIQEDLYKNINGANYRSIFAEVAGATGTMAVFNNTNNNLFFREYQSTVQQSLDYSYLKKYQIGEHYGAINTLVLARTPQEDNIVVKDEAMINAPGGKNLIDFPDVVSGHMSFYYEDRISEFHIEANKTYTFSITVDSVSVKPYKVSTGYGRNAFQHELREEIFSTDGERVSVTFTAPSQEILDANGDTFCFRCPRYNTVTTVDYSYSNVMLEKGSTATSFEPFVATGPKEVKLANNEILDDDRETLITPIFNAIKGMEWTGFEIDTVGLGWLECGDRISITDDSNGTIEGIITYLKITIDGGIKETIKSIPPIKTETNYAIAGGVMKTIYNTEIKVDKQNQEIQSIVSEQTQFENQTTENFTNITQNISSVVTSVQGSGGNNLIKNSAFFASDDLGRFLDWETGTESTILPPEYQQVEYIESTGTQYINTGVTLGTDDFGIQTSATFLQKPSGENPICSIWTSGYGYWNFFANSSGSINCYTQAHHLGQQLTFGEKYNLGLSCSSSSWSYSVNGTKLNWTYTPTSTNNTPLKIFVRGDLDSSNYGYWKVHNFKVFQNGDLTRNFIPCYNISSEAKGLYDTINDVFYTNQGTGEFIAGQATGIPIVYPSAEVAAHGSLSGQVIGLAGVLISQAILVKADDSSITEENKTYYSFSCRCKKNLAGTASVTITDGTDEGVWTIDFPNGTDADWEEFNIDKILPQSSELRITATGSSDSDFQITDMMLAVGDYHSQWQQASGESNNTQVSITTDGITVKNGNLATSWSRHNNQGFNAYKDRQLTASLNADEVIAPKAEFSKEIDMPPIKIVPQSDGWAFVSTIS